MADDKPTPPDKENAEVIEQKDVSDKTESEVQSEIDKMLAGGTPEEDHSDALDVDNKSVSDTNNTDAKTTDSGNTTNEATHHEQDSGNFTQDSGNPLDGADPSNIDPAQLEEQEWTLGGDKGDEVIQFKDMVFLLSEPDDDALLDIIGGEPDEQQSASENMRELCQATIKSPTLTDKRWDGLNLAERLGLMMEVSDFIGLDEFMDFQDVGAKAQAGI